MAQIDKFIKAMLDRPGGQILISSGEPPTMTVNGKSTPISKQRATVQQIRHLLAEIAPASAREDLRSTGEAQFLHQGQGLEPAVVVVRHSAECTQINLSPRGAVPNITSMPKGPPSLDPGPFADKSGSLPEMQAPSSRSLAQAPPPPEVPVEPVAPPPAAASPAAAPAAVSIVPTAGPVAVVPVKTIPKLVPKMKLPVPAGDTHAIDQFFRKLVSSGSSDLHMSSDEVPMVRKDGDMVRLPGAKKLSPDQLQSYLVPIMPEANREEFAKDNDTDFAYEIEGLARFRCNIFMDRKGMGAVFRIIPAKILTAEQLGLSEAIKDLCKLSKGLVLVTGPTGSGKSTTLCAMIDLINRSRGGHIITVEDPIEFVHPNKKCLVNQREVGVHTNSFKRALRAALREDPDIVLVGEMRDLETIAIAIETAETGHLVFGTLHTSTAPSTVDRIIDQYPPDQQEQIRVMLSESLRGVISQTLCKKIGGGRAAALEVLLITPAVSNLIREGKTFQIPSIMQTGKRMGMALLNDVLFEYVRDGLVDPDEALLKAVDKSTLRNMLRQANLIESEG